MNKRKKYINKFIGFLKTIIHKKLIVSGIITVIVLAAVIQPMDGYAADKIEFIKSYLYTALQFFQALWDSVRNVLSQIRIFFSIAYSVIWHPEKNLTAFMEGLCNSIQYLFWGSETSISTVFLKLVRIEADGLASMTANIVNSAINLINEAIDIINDLLGTSMEKIPLVP